MLPLNVAVVDRGGGPADVQFAVRDFDVDQPSCFQAANRVVTACLPQVE